MADTHYQRYAGLEAARWAVAALLGILWLLVALPALASGSTVDFTATPDSEYRYGVDWDSETGTGTGSQVTTGALDLQINNTYVCHADGSTSGALFVNPRCDASRGLFGVFANVICRVENLFATVMGLLYCSVQNAVLNPLLALLTLYVTLYGAMVILGLVPHTFGQAITRIGKMAIVAAVALNAHVAIGVGYTFFIGMTQMSIQVVFDLFTPDFVQSHESMTDMIQAGYMSSPLNPDESKRLYMGEHWMQNLDYTTHRVLGFFVEGGVGFVMVLLGLLVFMPPLFLVVVYLLLSIFKAFATAIVGYLLALLGITFLFTLSPIFVCLALFKTTAGYFDSWLRYLFSFTLQIMIIFVFLMFMVMIDLVSFFQQIGQLIRNYEYILSFGWIMIPLNVITLCRIERTGGRFGDIIYYKFNIDGTPGTAHGTQYEGFPRCVPEWDLREVLAGNLNYRSLAADPNPYPPGLDDDMMQRLMDAIDSGVELPEGSEEELPSGLEVVGEIFNKANDDLKLPFTEFATSADLIFFLLVRFVTVIILTYLLERFMRKIPHMASYLAGTGFSGRLGGGEQEMGDEPGIQHANAFSAVDTGFAKFKQAAYGGGYYPRGFISSTPRRLLGGVAAGIGAAGREMVGSSIAHGSNLGVRRDIRRELRSDQNIRQAQRDGTIPDSSPSRPNTPPRPPRPSRFGN